MRRRPRIIWFTGTEQKLIFRRLALYLEAGISLPRSFSLLMNETRKPSSLYILETLEQSILRGESLSQGMAGLPKYFTSFTIGFVSAGETSGTLAMTMLRISESIEKSNILRRKIVSALLYPFIVLISALLISGLLVFYIFPKILPVLEGLKTPLPITTRVLIWINSFCERNWLVLLILLVSCILIAIFLMQKKKVRKNIEWLLLRIPLLGSLYKYYVLATTLSILLVQLLGNVSILSALALAQKSSPGIIYPEALQRVQEDLLRGHTLSSALRQHTRLFPLATMQLIAAGESTGTLRENIQLLANVYERDLDELTQNLASLLEPLLMVFMGCIVGFIALAIVSPIYKITQSLPLH